MNRLNFFVSVLFAFSFTTAIAYQSHRPISYEEIVPNERMRDNSFESMVRVCGEKLRVAWVNYPLLRYDVPWIRDWDEQKIDDWIVDNFAFITQIQTNLFTKRITTPYYEAKSTQSRLVPRKFPKYGRASILQLQYGSQSVLIDIKGSGHTDYDAIIKDLSRLESKEITYEKYVDLDHSDGVLSLGESIAEVSRQLAVQKGLEDLNRKNNTKYQTSEVYFILAMPFEIIRSKGNIPAAIIGRQASFGRHFYYGSTSASGAIPAALQSVYRDQNGFAQHDGFGAALDFGGVEILSEDHREKFGMEKNKKEFDPQGSRAWRWAHETATAFDQQGDRGIIERHLREMLGQEREISSSWKSYANTWDSEEGLANKLDQLQFGINSIATDLTPQTRIADESDLDLFKAKYTGSLRSVLSRLADLEKEPAQEQKIAEIIKLASSRYKLKISKASIESAQVDRTNKEQFADALNKKKQEQKTVSKKSFYKNFNAYLTDTIEPGGMKPKVFESINLAKYFKHQPDTPLSGLNVRFITPVFENRHYQEITVNYMIGDYSPDSPSKLLALGKTAAKAGDYVVILHPTSQSSDYLDALQLFISDFNNFHMMFFWWEASKPRRINNNLTSIGRGGMLALDLLKRSEANGMGIGTDNVANNILIDPDGMNMTTSKNYSELNAYMTYQLDSYLEEGFTVSGFNLLIHLLKNPEIPRPENFEEAFSSTREPLLAPVDIDVFLANQMFPGLGFAYYALLIGLADKMPIKPLRKQLKKKLDPFEEFRFYSNQEFERRKQEKRDKAIKKL